MKTYDIKFSQTAYNDMKEIYSYISYNLIQTLIANKILNELKANILSLETMPSRFSLVKDYKHLFILKLIINKYIIFYNINETNNCVNIIRILYAKRNWINLI